MTKTELKALVDRVYASWNQSVPASNAKEIYQAWWMILHDLTVVETDAVVNRLVIRNSWMPRPGEIRRLVIAASDVEAPPTPLEAWQQMRQVVEGLHSGSVSPVELHDCVLDAVRRLGGAAAVSLSTNGDREQFSRLYTQVVEDWEAERYSPPPAP